MNEQNMDKNIFFAFYAVIVKNLRGVLLFDPEDEELNSRIEWLRKRFQYRNLGIPPSLYSERFNELFKYKVFRKLYYPVKEAEELINILSSIGYDSVFVEALVLASSYISPLMILSSKYLKLIEENSLGSVGICKELSIKDWKLHMRIADYTILDSYENSVMQAIEYIENINDSAKREEIINDRRNFYEKDMKRYWRILCDNPSKNFLYYLDPLLIVDKNIDKLKNRLKIEHAFGLAIIPVINLTIV